MVNSTHYRYTTTRDDTMASILIIEDEHVLAHNMGAALGLHDHVTTLAATGEDGLDQAAQHDPDLILLDYRLPSIDGLEVLRRLQASTSRAAVIMMTAHGDVHTAITAMKSGAADFLKKPLDLEELAVVVARTLADQRRTAGLNYYRDREKARSALNSIRGTSARISELKEWIKRLTARDVLASPQPPHVLLTGETGTGKDLAAKAIHYGGPRQDGQFVHVNCTSIPHELFESELFGHVRGAFTDAGQDKRGLFEVADGGTLLLDEVGHMSLDLQAKLLTVLDTATIRAVGDHRRRPINVHVIAATNRDLEGAIAMGEFRDDLYHRLRVLSFHLPPLREREDDVIELARIFVDDIQARFGISGKHLADSAARTLRAHPWPGNVRELLHVMESAVLLTDGASLTAASLNLPAVTTGHITIHLPTCDRTIEVALEEGGRPLEQIEHEIIEATLAYTKHNISKTARILGVSRDVIRHRIK